MSNHSVLGFCLCFLGPSPLTIDLKPSAIAVRILATSSKEIKSGCELTDHNKCNEVLNHLHNPSRRRPEFVFRIIDCACVSHEFRGS